MRKMRNAIDAPRVLVPELSERVDWAIRRAMSPSPESRPTSCREFVEDLYGKSVRPAGSTDTPAAESDLWYLVYRDENGDAKTVKGGTDGIRKALREGLLGDATNLVACRHHKQGPFQDLRSFPEFRDLLIAPEPLPSPSLTPTRPPGTTRTPMPPSGRWPSPSDTPTANLGAMPAANRFAGSSGLSARLASPSGRLAAPSARHLKPPPDPSKLSPVPEASSRLPHLPVAPTRRSRGFDVLMWLGVLVVAVATALAMFHFFPLK